MSHWSHIRGTIEIDTFARSTPEALYIAEMAVRHLPRISGSERNAAWYVNLKAGHCASSNVDEFNQQSNLYDDPHYKSFETQTLVILTLNGDLRDRDAAATLKETTKAIKRLAAKVWVKDCLIAITDSSDNTHVIHNPEYLQQIEISDWSVKLFNRDT